MNTKFKVGDRVRFSYPGLSDWDGVVTSAKYESHMGEDQSTVWVRTSNGANRVFYDEYVVNLNLLPPEDHVSEPDLVNHPAHYTGHPSGVEPITITKHESFLRGNVIKYLMRAPYKGRELEDLLKAQTYLQWEVDRVRNLESNS